MKTKRLREQIIERREEQVIRAQIINQIINLLYRVTAIYIVMLVILVNGVGFLWSGLFNPQSFTLKNGLQVVVLENHRADVVFHSIWYKIGAADDPCGKSGLAHYLEHLMFKGPAGSASARYQEEVTRIGGKYNAATGSDTTHYYTMVATEYLEKVVALEAARMRALTVIDSQAKTELGVILEERNMRLENSPIGRFLEILNARFLYNHPYRLPNIGWEHEIRGFTPVDVRSFYKKWYAPNNAIAIFAGDITLAKAKALAEKYYGGIPAKSLPPRRRLQEPPHRETIERIALEAEEIQVPYLLRLYQAPHFKMDNGKHTYAMQVLQYILEIDPWGLLYKPLVEEQKIATFVEVMHTVYTLDPTILFIMVQPAEGHTLLEVEEAINAQLTQILEQGIPLEAIERAKRQMIARAVFAHDSVFGGADDFGKKMALGIPITEIDNWIEYIKAVTPEEVNASARFVFGKNHHLTAHLLPKITIGKKGQPVKRAGGRSVKGEH
jgi:zinc protease